MHVATCVYFNEDIRLDTKIGIIAKIFFRITYIYKYPI